MIDCKSIGAAEGFELRMELDYDPFADPSDLELTDKQMQAYLDDEWGLVTVEVIASKAGVDLGRASYGSIEYGHYVITDDDDNVVETKYIGIHDIDNYVGSELSGEAISQAKEKLSELFADQKMSEQETMYTAIAADGKIDFLYADSMYAAYQEAKDTYGEAVSIRPSWYGEWECGSEQIATEKGNGCWYDKYGNHYKMKDGQLVA